MDPDVPLHDQLYCAQRELRIRERVYPVWVKEGRMRENDMHRELTHMQAIVGTLARLYWTEREGGRV